MRGRLSWTNESRERVKSKYLERLDFPYNLSLFWTHSNQPFQLEERKDLDDISSGSVLRVSPPLDLPVPVLQGSVHKDFRVASAQRKGVLRCPTSSFMSLAPFPEKRVSYRPSARGPIGPAESCSLSLGCRRGHLQANRGPHRVARTGFQPIASFLRCRVLLPRLWPTLSPPSSVQGLASPGFVRVLGARYRGSEYNVPTGRGGFNVLEVAPHTPRDRRRNRPLRLVPRAPGE